MSNRQCIPYSRKIWRLIKFGGLPCYHQIKIHARIHIYICGDAILNHQIYFGPKCQVEYKYLSLQSWNNVVNMHDHLLIVHAHKTQRHSSCTNSILPGQDCPLVPPGRKGTRARAVYCRKYTVFMPNFARITARYRPKPFISGAIENKVKKGALRFCVRLNLRLLSFNDPEYRLL